MRTLNKIKDKTKYIDSYNYAKKGKKEFFLSMFFGAAKDVILAALFVIFIVALATVILYLRIKIGI